MHLKDCPERLRTNRHQVGSSWDAEVRLLTQGRAWSWAAGQAVLPTGTSLSQKGIKTAPLPDIPRVLSRFHGAAWENAFPLLPCVSQACRVRFQSCEFVLHAQKKNTGNVMRSGWIYGCVAINLTEFKVHSLYNTNERLIYVSFKKN